MFFQRNVALYHTTNSVFLFISNRPHNGGGRIPHSHNVRCLYSIFVCHVSFFLSCFRLEETLWCRPWSYATDTLLKRVCGRSEETATEANVANGLADFGRAQRTSSVGGRAQLNLGTATGHLLRAEWQNRRAATRPCKMRQIRTVSCRSLVHHV